MKPLKKQFIAYLTANPGFHASGSLQRMEWIDSKGKLASAQNVGRRLRELVNEGKLQVEYRKNHAWYAVTAEKPKPRYQYIEVERDGVTVRQEVLIR